MNIDQIIAKELNIKISQVEKTIELLDDGNTVPFIARYRKEATGGLDDVTLRTLDERLAYLRNLEERKTEVIHLIDEQGAMTDELYAQIEAAEVLQRVEDLYKPFKKKKSTRASMARALGLSPLADMILNQKNTPEEISEYAKQFVNSNKQSSEAKNTEVAALSGNVTEETVITSKKQITVEGNENSSVTKAQPAEKQFAGEKTEKSDTSETQSSEKQITTPEEAIAGAKDIIAEIISDDPDINDRIRKKTMATGLITTEATDPDESTVYDMYYGSSEKISKVPNHRILAINRGEKEKKLKVKVSCDKDAMESIMARMVIIRGSRCTAILEDVIADAYKRLVAPSIEREMRKLLTERAEAEAVKVFAKNTEKLLMVPPVAGARIISIDPGYRTGCKVAVLDETGMLLAHTTVFPTKPKCQVAETEAVLEKLIEKYEINTIVIGNGTASRETEEVVAAFLKRFGEKIKYTIVNEAGTSVYSASKLAAEEYPDLDVTVRGAISLGRRLQDPLAELVKIPIKSIGVGQYQHDINQGLLEKALDNVVEDCVNRVGVELNTASASLLSRVVGINKTIAGNIVSYRESNGKFRSRKELLKVSRLGAKAFEQCAGFIRIAGADDPLDNTAVHPESYEIAEALIKRLESAKAESAKTESVKAGVAKTESVKAGMEQAGEAKSDVEKTGLETSTHNKSDCLNECENRKFHFNATEPSDREKSNGLAIGGGAGTAETEEKLNSLAIGVIAEDAAIREIINDLATEYDVGIPTLNDILEELKRPGRDPREDAPPVVFRNDVRSFEDLALGMELEGTVRNVVDFGAFVDIGVKNDGLVHISQLSDSYVKDPMEVVAVGDTVKVRIIEIDEKRQRVSLSMRKK